MKMENKDLSFIEEGTESITILEGKSSEFCPHIYRCYMLHIDSNCFYQKYLHCQEAKKYEK